jgi:glycosyltransferase involved in cell wall biosynthesis
MDALRPVHVYPDYSGDNRYQTMLHSRLESVGAYAEPVQDVTAHLRSRAEAADPGVTHLHWTAPILQRSAGPFSAKLALDAFTASLRTFKEAGGRLVWTIHNVLPHDGRHRWAEIELATLLADEADAIHVLSEATFDAVGDLYPVDRSKVTIIGISSYLGEYPDWVSRAGARERLGIMPEEKVLITLGGIRPYKGLDLLVELFEPLARRDPSLRLLIAGRPGNLPGVPELRHRCANSPRVIAHFDHLPDDHLQVWMGAADFAVLPYRAVLNSSAFKLAESFGLPVLGPRVGALVAEDGQAHVRLFDPADDRSLNVELQSAIRELVADPEGAAAARASSLASAARFGPADMGEAYAGFIAPFLPHG